MTPKTIGLLSPGDMGHSIGGVLHSHGLEVLTCLQDRSSRTRELAARAGITNAADLEDLVQRADIVLSVLVPAEARSVAMKVAKAVDSTKSDLLYVDCNAIAPRTVRDIADTLQASGARFADVGIIGPPPRQPGTKFYASGPGAEELSSLRNFGLDVRVIGDAVGQASGLKMCYGALTKGLQALGTELLTAARLMGLEKTLRDEQEESIPDVLGWLQRGVPSMPPKAHRWVGEMKEIASCFEDLGMTPEILLGAADFYQFVSSTPIGRESPENRDKARDLDGVIEALAGELSAKSGASS